MTRADQSRERRLKIRGIRDALAQNIDHPQAHLVEKYRREKRLQSQKYRQKRKQLMQNYIDFNDKEKAEYWEEYVKASEEYWRERERHSKKYIASKEQKAITICLLDSFTWTDLVLFE